MRNRLIISIVSLVLSFSAVRELLKQPGKTHKLSFSRKGKTTLKTRDLLE